MRIFWLFSAAASTVSPALADTGRTALSEIARCADIAVAAERLQCYDSAAVAAKSVLATPPEQRAADQNGEGGGVLDWFGLGGTKPVTKVDDFGRTPQSVDQAKEVNEIHARLATFALTATGRAVFTLDNGQVWTQIQGDRIEVHEPRSGAELKIERALFGGYALTFSERTGLIRVRRTR